MPLRWVGLLGGNIESLSLDVFAKCFHIHSYFIYLSLSEKLSRIIASSLNKYRKTKLFLNMASLLLFLMLLLLSYYYYYFCK